MQTLVELLLELKTLAASDAPDKLDKINKLFDNPRAPAEFQVGRHYVSRALARSVEEQISSVDPAHRKTAIATARLVFAKAHAARMLRHVFHDPDVSVRGLARRTMRKLGLDELTPPELRRRERGRRANTTAWAFGIFASDWVTAQQPKKPARVDALAKYGLPPLKTVNDVEKLVGVDELAPLMRAGAEPGSGYVEFDIP